MCPVCKAGNADMNERRPELTLVQRISQAQVQPGEVAIFSLAQAGILIKTNAGTTLAVDPYLSDCVERLAGFKRLIPAPISAEDLDVDVLACTHSHPDHLDVDALSAVAAHARTHFVGAPDCADAFRQQGLSASRFTILRPGEEFTYRDLMLRATFADHGVLAPEAIGFLIRAAEVSIFNAGDTGYAPDRIMATLTLPVDVMTAPINGAFGNLTETEACRLAAMIRPNLLIGNHFGMFAEQGGNPRAFIEASQGLPDGIQAVVMKPGELIRHRNRQQEVRK